MNKEEIKFKNTDIKRRANSLIITLTHLTLTHLPHVLYTIHVSIDFYIYINS